MRAVYLLLFKTTQMLDSSKPLSDKKSYRVLNVGAVRVLLIHDPTGNPPNDDTTESNYSDDEAIENSVPSGTHEIGGSTESSYSGSEAEEGSSNACVAWCFPVGSFDDPDDLHGLAHFCEHMIFSE